MFTEVIAFTVRPGQMDQLIRTFQDSITAGAAGQPGFVGMLLLTDRAASQAIALMLWETETARLERGGDHLQPPPMTALLEELPHSTCYEVSVRVDCTAQGILWMHGI